MSIDPLLLGTILVVIAFAFAISALVGVVLAPRLPEPDTAGAGRPAIPTRPPGG
jgi:hypothetical protein